MWSAVLVLAATVAPGAGPFRCEATEIAGVAAYYLLLPLALAGGWLLRRRRRDLLVLLAPVALVVALSLIGYGIPRFRAPAEIAIVVLAAVAVTHLLERRRPSGAPPSG